VYAMTWTTGGTMSGTGDSGGSGLGKAAVDCTGVRSAGPRSHAE
jgi:hypothetical protein